MDVPEQGLGPGRRRFLATASAAAAAATFAGCAPIGLRGAALATRSGASPDVTGEHSLKAHATACHLLTGFALNVAELRESEAYRRVVREQSSIAVAENAMKWGALRPAPDQFRFDDADEILRFCEAERIKLRGHNLCWHEYLPKWFAGYATSSNARTLLTQHIRTVAGRYAGRLHSWDVVNEAIDVKDGRPDGLRDSPWLRLIGESYIELAFRTAREADPAALLTYNEYGVESEGTESDAKRAATLLLLRRLKQRHVPIDAVGIQSHIRASQPRAYGSCLRRFIQSCREMDLQVFISELDVDDRTLPGDVAVRDAGVAAAYRAYLDVVLRAPNVRAVLMWGVDDAHTWLTGTLPRADGQPQRPLLFDRELRAKPAFVAVGDAMDGARATPAAAPARPRLPALR